MKIAYNSQTGQIYGQHDVSQDIEVAYANYENIAFAINPPLKEQDLLTTPRGRETRKAVTIVDLKNMIPEVARPNWVIFRQTVLLSAEWVRLGNAAGAALVSPFVDLLWQVGDNSAVLPEIGALWQQIKLLGQATEGEVAVFRQAAQSANLPEQFAEII